MDKVRQRVLGSVKSQEKLGNSRKRPEDAKSHEAWCSGLKGIKRNLEELAIRYMELTEQENKDLIITVATAISPGTPLGKSIIS